LKPSRRTDDDRQLKRLGRANSQARPIEEETEFVSANQHVGRLQSESEDLPVARCASFDKFAARLHPRTKSS
jgi:hypothetical protein